MFWRFIDFRKIFYLIWNFAFYREVFSISTVYDGMDCLVKVELDYSNKNEKDMHRIYFKKRRF